jgi:hypothetical protein
MDDAMSELTAAVGSQVAVDAREAAIGAARATLDFRLRYRPPSEIDLARFELWARQVLVDVEEEDALAVRGDWTTLLWIRDRFEHTLSAGARATLQTLLGDLEDAVDTEDLEGAAVAAQEIRDLLVGL